MSYFNTCQSCGEERSSVTSRSAGGLGFLYCNTCYKKILNDESHVTHGVVRDYTDRESEKWGSFRKQVAEDRAKEAEAEERRRADEESTSKVCSRCHRRLSEMHFANRSNEVCLSCHLEARDY
jgi:hypothetical protein